MPKFELSCSVTVSAYTTVEAETLEKAIQIAEGRQVVLGGPGCGESEDESWIIEEADGSPADIHA